MAAKPKYVAEGFEQDLVKLLNDFVEESSVEFSDFAKSWRYYHFSLVFMGRPDPTELSEFTNEMFRITSQFLSSPSYYQRIGAIYTLYALFRNQIAEPKIKIRIEMSHWRIIKALLQDAMQLKFRTLHYVISFLMKNAFLYVAHQTLKGPLVGATQKVSKHGDAIANLKGVYKSGLLDYSTNNKLAELRDLDKQCLEAKKNLSGLVKNFSLKDDGEMYQILIEDMNNLLNPKPGQSNTSESLGSRRAKIKAASFLRQSKDRFGKVIDDDNEDVDPDYVRTSPKKKMPKGRRMTRVKKIGRPSKKPKIEVPEEPKSDEEIDISHLLVQQNDLYLPPEEDTKKLKSKPGRYYYKLSPKRGNTSDPDSPN